MKKQGIRTLAAALLAALLLGALPALAADGEDGAEESSTIDFLSYEEAVTYFDFDTAASNWCTNFGMDPAVSLEEAKAAILHGTDRELVIRLATFARDVGYGDEKLVVTNAFRPACYQEVIGLQNFSSGAFIGMILLIPAVVTFLIDLRKKDAEALGFSAKRLMPSRRPGRDLLLGVFTALTIGFVLLVLGSFVVMTFIAKYPYDLSFSLKHLETVMDRGLPRFFGNSLLISLFVAFIGTAVGYVTAYMTARSGRSVTGKILHLTSISSLAIPGIVLGLGYVICFSKSFIYGTAAILIFVNIIHFFSSPYMMAHNAMKKLNPHFEDVGKTLCVGRFRLMRDVFIPNTLDTIAEMFGYFFVNSMITISAVAFLWNSRTMPLSIMINQLEHDMMMEAAAFVSLVILLSNIAMKLLIGGVKKFCRRRGVGTL